MNATSETEVSIPADVEAAVIKRLNAILYRTPQYHHFNWQTTSLDEALRLVEEIMTVQFQIVLVDAAKAQDRVVELERERQTVREFFGVTNV